MADRMLIIDDDDIVLESCRRVFSATGFQVSCTTSPPEGLRLIADSFFDVILCDWKMPGFNGMDVIEELERRSPDSAIVMISGYPTAGRATEALKRGAMKYVAKPFTPGEIVEAVREAIRCKAVKEK
jgi:DNA-binding NtrC family response regulator